MTCANPCTIPYVAIIPTSGFGNQLFMVAALLGYAEQHGHTPVFWDEPSSSWEHKGSQFRIKAMFPHIRVLTAAERTHPWTVVREQPEKVFTYASLPHIPGNVKLEGYFQSDFYGPSTFPTPPSPPLLTPALLALPWHTTFFLHVRRGDYLHPSNSHHVVELRDYWRQSLTTMDPNCTCFVVSDDMEWCQKELVEIVGDAWKGQWAWCPTECSDVEAFFWMQACDVGGICANSTFSWWAAWYLVRRIGPTVCCFMPRQWGTYPLPPTTHLGPAWAKQI